MATVAQVRASWLKYTVRSAKRHPAPDGPRVLEQMPVALRSEIREAGPLGWLPGERFVELCTVIADALGPRGARAFWQKSLHECIQEPLIRPLAMGGLYLFGRTPEGLYRRTPQAWGLVTRGFGELSLDAGEQPGSLVFRVRGLPVTCRHRALLYVWEGGFMGQAQFVGHHAIVDTDDGRLAKGDADFSIRWQKIAD